MKGEKTGVELDLPAIKALYKNLKKARVVLDWKEFAKMLPYNRTYVSRVINGHEPLTPEFVNKVKDRIADGTFKVPRENPEMKKKGPLPGVVEGIEVRLLRIEAKLEVLGQTVIELQHKVTGVSSAKLSLELETTTKEFLELRLSELQNEQ